jgi:hypothetical protein
MSEGRGEAADRHRLKTTFASVACKVVDDKGKQNMRAERHAGATKSQECYVELAAERKGPWQTRRYNGRGSN